MNGAVCIDHSQLQPIEPPELTRVALLAGWHEDQIVQLHCLVDHETDYRPGVVSWSARGPGSSIGIAQIHHRFVNGFSLPVGYVPYEGAKPYTKPYHLPPMFPNHRPTDLLDTRTNLEVALQILPSAGWLAWDGYTREVIDEDGLAWSCLSRYGTANRHRHLEQP